MFTVNAPIIRSNHPPVEELWEIARKLGADAANGRESAVKFDLMLVEGSFQTTLNLDENKYGPGDSDADRMFKKWTEGKTECQFHDKKSDSGKKTLSNIKKMIKLGGLPKWGRSVYDNANKLLVYRIEEQKKGRKVKDAHNCLLEYATAQLSSDYLIDGDELRDYVYKKEPDAKDEEARLEAARRELNSIVNGKTYASASSKAAAQAAVNEITKGLAALARNRVK